MTSCIDKKYDLSEIDNDNDAIGDEFVMPLANIEIKFDELFEFDFQEIKSSEIKEVEIPETFDEVYDIGSGLGDDVTDWLGENVENITITAEILNVLPISLDIKIELLDESGNELKSGGKSLLPEMTVNSNSENGGITSLSYEMSSEVIDNLNNASQIRVMFDQREPKVDTLTLNPNDVFKIHLSLKKEGGLKL